LKEFKSVNIAANLIEITDNAKRNIDALKGKCKNYSFTSLADFSIYTLTFSEGIVELNSENNNIDELLQEAEKLLKGNKKANNLSK